MDPDHEFCHQYARAREMQAEHYADEIIEIADSVADPALVQIAKLRVDARKWVMARLDSKERSKQISIVGSNSSSINIESNAAAYLTDAELELKLVQHLTASGWLLSR